MPGRKFLELVSVGLTDSLSGKWGSVFSNCQLSAIIESYFGTKDRCMACCGPLLPGLIKMMSRYAFSVSCFLTIGTARSGDMNVGTMRL